MKLYSVAIPNLPVIPNRRVTKFVKWMSNLSGFYGINPNYPHGTIVFFKSLNAAKKARNEIKSYPQYEGSVGENICEWEMGADRVLIFKGKHND